MSPLPIDLGDGASLRRYTMDDLPALWEAVQEERDRLGVWMPWVEPTRTIEDQAVWLRRVVADEQNLIRAGVDNLRSRAVPERLGFTFEGVARGGERGSGGYYDLAVYAILEDEWGASSGG